MSSHLLDLAHSELTGPHSANIPKNMNECPAFIGKNRDTSLSPSSPRPAISFGHVRSNLLEKKKCFLFSFLFPVRKWSPKAMLSLSATQSCHTHVTCVKWSQKIGGCPFCMQCGCFLSQQWPPLHMGILLVQLSGPSVSHKFVHPWETSLPKNCGPTTIHNACLVCLVPPWYLCPKNEMRWASYTSHLVLGACDGS